MTLQLVYCVMFQIHQVSAALAALADTLAETTEDASVTRSSGTSNSCKCHHEAQPIQQDKIEQHTMLRT